MINKTKQRRSIHPPSLHRKEVTTEPVSTQLESTENFDKALIELSEGQANKDEIKEKFKQLNIIETKLNLNTQKSVR